MNPHQNAQHNPRTRPKLDVREAVKPTITICPNNVPNLDARQTQSPNIQYAADYGELSSTLKSTVEDVPNGRKASFDATFSGPAAPQAMEQFVSATLNEAFGNGGGGLACLMLSATLSPYIPPNPKRLSKSVCSFLAQTSRISCACSDDWKDKNRRPFPAGNALRNGDQRTPTVEASIEKDMQKGIKFVTG